MEGNGNSPSVCFMSAVRLSQAIKSKQISCEDVMVAFLSQIHRWNAKINAVVSLRPAKDLLAEAKARDDHHPGTNCPALYGFPFAVKDLFHVKGLPTTYGSPIYVNNVATADDIIVERLRESGVIFVGKTNSPEFGAGSQTFNSVFGVTRNPYNLELTAGGSSGGAAAALAARMLPVADGSDLGGSLRNPASFCNVVGFRTSLFLSPIAGQPAHSLSVVGPMGRSVEDVSLLLDVIAGPDSRAPPSVTYHKQLAKARPESASMSFLAYVTESLPAECWRLGWCSVDLPIEKEVNAVFHSARPFFVQIGCCVVDVQLPFLSDALDVFSTLRAWSFARTLDEEYRNHRQLLKDTVVWNIEQGITLKPSDLQACLRRKADLHKSIDDWMVKSNIHFLIAPSCQVLPFDASTEWIKSINGHEQQTYISWMSICCAISALNLPSLSVPCGFSSGGCPVGLQIIGRRNCDKEVLRIGKAFQEKTQYSARLPRCVWG